MASPAASRSHILRRQEVGDLMSSGDADRSADFRRNRSALPNPATDRDMPQ